MVCGILGFKTFDCLSSFAARMGPTRFHACSGLRKEKLKETKDRFVARVGDRMAEVQDDFSNIVPRLSSWIVMWKLGRLNLELETCGTMMNI